MIRSGDLVYTASGANGPAPITAFEVKTGPRPLDTRREFAKSQLLLADDKLIILDEDGVLALATPTGLTVHSRVQLLDKVAWTLPSFAGTTLYIRDRKNLMALISAPGEHGRRGVARTDASRAIRDPCASIDQS
jgi:outer membrane protein assembly factor BamB